MNKKKRTIRKKDARILLSEVLPYEVPPSYNNRGLYNFINEKNVVCTEREIRATGLDPVEVAYLSMVLGRKIDFKNNGKKNNRMDVHIPRDSIGFTIPFNFTIRHQSNKLRTLSVPHPRAQIEIINFYSRYSDLILYYTSRSHFSLRHPARVARYSVIRDWLFEDSKKGHDGVEEDRYEYEWLRSYFTYKKYSHLYKFYDSKEYRSYERRFGYLVKADIAKCFDSIYTHSVAWAVHGHDLVKANVGASKKSFGGEFDNLMQRLNHNETSGILIGSEVSRIFAELILQSVDVEVESRLRESSLTPEKDYKILRYVDDYFIFLSDDSSKQVVLDTLERSLRRYKLHLNPAKEEGEFTPWLSPLTSAKQRTAKLIQESIKGIGDEVSTGKLPRPYVMSDKLIVGYKGVLIDTGVSHIELANYALSRVEIVVENVIKQSKESWKDLDLIPLGERVKGSRSTGNALLSLLEFSFFVYSGAPRMTPSVKIARIVSSIIRYSRLDNVPFHERERLEMSMHEELVSQLNRSRKIHQSSVVTATLLDCLSDLGPRYSLGQEDLAKFCGFKREFDYFSPPVDMNAFMFFSMLLYVQDSDKYSNLRESCLNWALDLQNRPINDSERSIVGMNLVSCPFIDWDIKKRVLASYGYCGSEKLQGPVGQGAYGNVDWRRFNLYSALQEKRQYEVY